MSSTFVQDFIPGIQEYVLSSKSTPKSIGIPWESSFFSSNKKPRHAKRSHCKECLHYDSLIKSYNLPPACITEERSLEEGLEEIRLEESFFLMDTTEVSPGQKSFQQVLRGLFSAAETKFHISPPSPLRTQPLARKKQSSWGWTA